MTGIILLAHHHDSYDLGLGRDVIRTIPAAEQQQQPQQQGSRDPPGDPSRDRTTIVIPGSRDPGSRDRTGTGT